MQEQLRARRGIFECDGSVVFSASSCHLGSGVYSVGIGELSSKLGGEGPLATPSWVNTETFYRAWKNIRRAGDYKQFDWTVKALAGALSKRDTHSSILCFVGSAPARRLRPSSQLWSWCVPTSPCSQFS